jgi:hypothetical protein
LLTATHTATATPALELTPNEQSVQGTHQYFVTHKTCSWGDATTTLTIQFAGNNSMTLSSGDPRAGVGLTYARLGPDLWVAYRGLPAGDKEEYLLSLGQNAFTIKDTYIALDNQRLPLCEIEWLRI